jgi:hypothetical protein
MPFLGSQGNPTIANVRVSAVKYHIHNIIILCIITLPGPGLGSFFVYFGESCLMYNGQWYTLINIMLKLKLTSEHPSRSRFKLRVS